MSKLGYSCIYCKLPIEGTMYGAGDGTGQKFACPTCFWRKQYEDSQKRAGTAEDELKRAEQEVKKLSIALAESNAEVVEMVRFIQESLHWEYFRQEFLLPVENSAEQATVHEENIRLITNFLKVKNHGRKTYQLFMRMREAMEEMLKEVEAAYKALYEAGVIPSLGLNRVARERWADVASDARTFPRPYPPRPVSSLVEEDAPVISDGPGPEEGEA